MGTRILRITIWPIYRAAQNLNSQAENLFEMLADMQCVCGPAPECWTVGKTPPRLPSRPGDSAFEPAPGDGGAAVPGSVCCASGLIRAFLRARV